MKNCLYDTIHDFSVCLRTGSNPADIHRFRSHTGKLAIEALLMGGITVLVYYHYIFVIVALHRTKLHALQKKPCQKISCEYAAFSTNIWRFHLWREESLHSIQF